MGMAISGLDHNRRNLRWMISSPTVSRQDRVRVVSRLLTAVLGIYLFVWWGCSSSRNVIDHGAGPPNTLSEAEIAAGWELLFDGRTFSGWRGLGMDYVPSEHWVIEEGTIRKLDSADVPIAADGQPLEGADLMTEEVFEDFELYFEWKVATGANSGIKYNVSEAYSMEHEPRNAALGFEYQILDDENHPDAMNGRHRTAGALYDLVPPNQKKRLRPVGEFNSGRIRYVGGKGEHWLNGEKIVEFEVGSPEFDSLLVASKYVDYDRFAERRAGHIVLQDHNDEVWFRNLKIRRLDP